MIFFIKEIRSLVLLWILFTHVTLSHFMKCLKVLVVTIYSIHKMCLLYRVKVRKILWICFQSVLFSQYRWYISKTITLRLLIFWYLYSFYYFPRIVVIMIIFTYVKANLPFLNEIKILISNYLINAFVRWINPTDKLVWN